MYSALISNIQRFSLDDGPGIRTTVFFKGCSLQCAWCHNPECIPFSTTMHYNMKLCSSCTKCVSVCPTNARKMENERCTYDRDACILCGACVKVCRSGATKIIGEQYTPEFLYNEILKDINYYKTSDGGVTFSGGEPALFADYIIEVAKLCKNRNIHIALDTAGNVPLNSYEKLRPYVDVFLYDIKCISEERHMEWICASNKRILDNIVEIDKYSIPIIVRVPVIKHFNDDLAEQKKIASFLTAFSNINRIQLLPYHNYGTGKYLNIGMDNRIEDHTTPSKECMQDILDCYLALKLNAEIY